MFRISQKCAKHGKFGFGVVPTYVFANSLRLHTVQNWITHHPNPKSPHRVHLLWRITGRISLRQISHWAHEVDPLCKYFWITLRIQRKKGNAGVKWHEYLWRQVISEVYSTVSATDNFKIQCWRDLGVSAMDLPNVTALSTSASSFQNKFPWKTPKNLRSEYQS